MTANTAHLINVMPSVSRCHRCLRVTLSGLDYGMPYTVDAHPLTTHGELAARLSGRQLYRFIAGYVTYREAIHIRSAHDYPVLASHSCAPVSLEHIEARHVPLFIGLTEPPSSDEPYPTLLELNPATGSLRPTPVPDPAPPF